MPAPGDQHRPQAGAANPFLKEPQRINEFTAQEIATLQSRLDKQLGPEYISNRPGAGGQKVHYVAAEKIINLANEVFGFNGWSSQIINTTVDFCDENINTGKVDVGLAIIVRVTLRDGTYHEDVGYGHIENCKGKAAAFEKARKEAATDALKRALRNFGNLLGNCLYDKEYLQKVTKIKAQPSHKWDADNLHRHPSYAPVKQEPPPIEHKPAAPAANPGNAPIVDHTPLTPQENEDEFGGDLFDEVELSESHSDGVALKDTSGIVSGRPQQQLQGAPSNTTSQNRGTHQNLAQTGVSKQPNALRARGEDSTPPNMMHASDLGNSGDRGPHMPPPGQDGFITARNNTDAEGIIRATGAAFNPTFQSPSIRRTAGVNHAASGPVKRDMVSGLPAQPSLPPQPPQQQGPAAPRHVVNPSLNPSRQLGAPVTPRKPGAFRAPGPANGQKRQPDGRSVLSDVSNMAVNGNAAPGSRGVSPEKGLPTDSESAKRARLGEA